MFLFSGIAWLAWESTQARSLAQQADFVRGQTANLYTNYTGERAPINPALAVSRAVKAAGGARSDILQLSSVLFSAIETVPGVSVESLQFDASENQLTLRLIYPNFESATRVEQAVKTVGGNFRSGGVREQSGRLLGDGVFTIGGGS